MPQLSIEMTYGELFALDLIATDKQVWADNVLTHRAWAAKEDLKKTPEWAQALAAISQGGGDVTDDWAVLLKGKELGLFKTAAAKQAEAEAAALLASPDVPVEADQNAVVLAHALKLKIDLVNRQKTDGKPPFAISVQTLDAIRGIYSDTVADLTAKQATGEALTEEEIGTLGRIRAGFAAFKQIDELAEVIIAAGDPATPIENDERWGPFSV